MRDGMRRSRKTGTEETVAGNVAYAIGYALLTGAAIWLMIALVPG